MPKNDVLRKLSFRNESIKQKSVHTNFELSLEGLDIKFDAIYSKGYISFNP